MADHPSTFGGDATSSAGVEWNDRASIHLKGDGGGLLDGLKGVHRGTLAEMVAMVRNMPPEERGGYVIQKAGDHRLDTDEIMALAGREDFPG